MFPLTNNNEKKSIATMRNQDNPQGRHFGFSSETNRDRFLDSGPARGRQVLKDMEHFSLPEAAQSAELLEPSQMAAQPSLAHSWAGLLSNWNENTETKDKKSKKSAPSSC